MAALYKDIFCVGFASPEIESKLWKCFERCTIEGEKVTMDTFEPPERRDDYMSACIEVAEREHTPFRRRASMPSINACRRYSEATPRRG